MAMLFGDSGDEFGGMFFEPELESIEASITESGFEKLLERGPVLVNPEIDGIGNTFAEGSGINVGGHMNR
jgi:hypothetical protein